MFRRCLNPRLKVKCGHTFTCIYQIVAAPANAPGAATRRACRATCITRRRPNQCPAIGCLMPCHGVSVHLRLHMRPGIKRVLKQSKARHMGEGGRETGLSRHQHALAGREANTEPMSDLMLFRQRETTSNNNHLLDCRAMGGARDGQLEPPRLSSPTRRTFNG